MRYKNHIRQITEALKNYMTLIDGLEAQYHEETEKFQKEIEEMNGKYTPEYIGEFKKNYQRKDYKSLMNDFRSNAGTIVKGELEAIKRQIYMFVNAPAKEDFINKINSYFITGIKPSNVEFKIMQDSATSYTERRLLNQLAETRTKEEQKVEVDEHGNPTRKSVDVKNPYTKLEVPDVDKIMDSFGEYERNALYLLNSYSGKNATLYTYLENGAGQALSLTSDSYFRNKKEEVFTAVMDKANSIMEDVSKKKSLTEADKRLIDSILDPRYADFAKDRVQKIASLDANLAGLLMLDERYSKYLNDVAV